MSPAPAILLEGVTKRFKRTPRRAEYTTLKTELVRWLRGERRQERPAVIEALKGVDLTIPRGSTVGVVGRNGSGKSTLLKLITGIYSPTSGRLTVNGRISALLELGAGFHPDFTGRENIFINGMILGMTRADIHQRFDDIVAFAELGEFIDEPVRTYSSGMFMRLAFAVATHVEPDILIVDEILSVGDEHFGRRSRARMEEFKRQGKTILLVTHDLSTVENWCDWAAWLDGGVTRLFGPPAQVVAQYRRAIAAAEAQQVLTGSSALQSPAAALPAAPAPRPAGALTLSAVELLHEGPLSPRQPLGVRLRYRAAASTAGLARVEVLDEAGRTLLSERLALARVAEGEGAVVLRVEALPLCDGDYTVRAQVSVEDGAGTPREVRLTMAGTPGPGLLKPACTWQQEPQQPVLRAVSAGAS